MSSPFTKLPVGSQRFSGYTSDPSNAQPDYISYPSSNCLVTDDGKVESRKGYQEDFSIGVDGFSATCFYHTTYDIAFFALGTKLFYRDFTAGATYDTGITLTSGTVTRFDEFNGDIYLSNTTDGIYRIMVARLNGNVAAGAATITLDVDGAARLSVFGDTSGDIRIRGTNEAFASLVVSTGVLTLTGTASQAYSDNDIAIFVDRYASLEKASKILFWKSRMHIMGFPSATNADQPNNTVLAGQFVVGQTGVSGIELIVDYTFGTGGSTKIAVGGGGRITNILGVADYIYFFTERKVFATAASSIFSSGSSIGLTIPDEKDVLHGCLNEDCATVMGDNAITYISDDHRFIRQPIDTESGAPIGAPEEDFDVDIRDHLKDMDRDQTGALVYHFRGGRQTIYQVRENGQWYWHIFDHNIIRAQGSNFVRGAWQAPWQISPVKGFFERDGVLYGTDPSDDKVYRYFDTLNDNGIPIQVTIATGEFNVGDAMMEQAQMQGEINQAAMINIRCYVTNNTSGRRSGSAKIISGASYSYGVEHGVGIDPVGAGGVESETVTTAKWRKGFDVYPSEANFVQLIAENFTDGGYFSINSYSLTGKQYGSSFSSSL